MGHAPACCLLFPSACPTCLDPVAAARLSPPPVPHRPLSPTPCCPSPLCRCQAVTAKYGKSLDAAAATSAVEETAALVTDAELPLAPLALKFLVRLLAQQPQLGDVVVDTVRETVSPTVSGGTCGDGGAGLLQSLAVCAMHLTPRWPSWLHPPNQVSPQTMALVRSPLLQGAVLDALQAFFAACTSKCPSTALLLPLPRCSPKPWRWCAAGCSRALCLTPYAS